MKTFFHNKHLFVLFFSVLLLINSKTTAQDFIDKFEGIPIFTSPIWWGWFQENHFVDSLKAAGIDVLTMGLSEPSPGANEPDLANKINIINNYGLKVLAIDAKNLNYIQYYTDAKYSVWKAIGTPPNEGNATLYRNTSKTEVVNNSYIRIKSQFAEDTCKMTWGPYYKQDLKYQIKYEDTSLIITYRAAFDLKIEHNPASAHYPPMESDNPEDTICVIQVTRSTCSSIGVFNCTDTINAMVIKRGDFDGLNQFKELYFEYTLLDDPCLGSTTPNPDFPPPQHPVNIYRPEEIPPGPRADSEYIQFNVLWQGNSRYLLSLDKVTVSDRRGRRLFGPDSSDAHYNIEQQLDTLGNANELVVGWLGVDEPTSIDQYEPIKKVKRLLDEKNMNKPLVIPWMGRWSGYVNHPNDFGAMSLNPWQEYLIKGGNLNIQQNFYMFDYPCTSEFIPSSYNILFGWNTQDWREMNINVITELNYKKAYELDNRFGISIQCGEVLNTQAFQRDIEPVELLYNTNLALMYGAKYLSLYSYMAQRSIDSCHLGLLCKGLVNFATYGGII